MLCRPETIQNIMKFVINDKIYDIKIYYIDFQLNFHIFESSLHKLIFQDISKS